MIEIERKHPEFVAAQNSMLELHKVEAQSEYLETSSINGHTHILKVGEGHPIVLINGIGTPASMWAPLMAELHGFQLNAIELPGYGLTDAPKDFAINLRENMVKFLLDVLDCLGIENAFIISNSLGSWSACCLALDSNRVKSLVHLGCPAVLLDTSAPLPMRLLSNRFLGRILTKLNPPSQKQVVELSKMVNEHPMELALVKLLVETEKLPDYRDMFLTTLHYLIRIRGNRPGRNLDELSLQKINIPNLFIWGKDEPFGSIQVAKKAVSIMPNAELRVVEGGHAPWLKYSKEISLSLRPFLEQQFI